MMPDPKWLEILKASGWKTSAIAAAAALLIYGNAKKLLPAPLEPWMIQVAEAALLLCGCLTVASISSAVAKASKGPAAKLVRYWTISREKHLVAKNIAYMTPKEREIIGYLLAKNRKMFPNTADGGHANTLIAKRIVVCALLPGQAYTAFAVPFKVPDHVWNVLIKHKSEFPYVPSIEGNSEPHPWRVHWMSR